MLIQAQEPQMSQPVGLCLLQLRLNGFGGDVVKEEALKFTRLFRYDQTRSNQFNQRFYYD